MLTTERADRRQARHEGVEARHLRGADTLAAGPFGRVLLWFVTVGLVALALWQASGAI
jgi:hypothetical protein